MSSMRIAPAFRDRVAGVRVGDAVPVLAALAPGAIGLVLWAVALGHIELTRISDYGLLPALPWTFYAAVAAVAIGIVLALSSARLREPVLALHLAALILIVHGTPAITYGTLRYAWAWKHVGIVDYILRHGSVNPDIQFLTAYHNWPGFFALSALFTRLAGYDTALAFASWAPVFFNLLFLGALIALFGALTRDRRRVWLAATIFFAASWTGQDYFSPQAFAYTMFLVIVWVCVTWFRMPDPPGEAAMRRVLRSARLTGWSRRTLTRSDSDVQFHVATGRRERTAMIALVVALVVVVASSHQLTPLIVVLALTGLVVFQRLAVRSLPALAAVLSVGWVALFAVGFLRGNLYWIVDSLGALTSNANATLINLATASAGQRNVATIDRGLTLGIWVLGSLGVLRMLAHRRLDLSAVVLAAAPFGALGPTSYGGEILFRVYFFSLPFFALLATGLFYPTAEAGRSRRATLAQGALVGLLLCGLMFAYYGKERQNYFSHDEVRASQLLYGTAPPRSLLIGGVNDYPWAYTHYEQYSYVSLADLLPADRRRAITTPDQLITEITRQYDAPCTYLIITASQEATVNATGVMPSGSLETIQRRLTGAPGFHVLLHNPSATVFGTAGTASQRECRLP